MIVEKDKPFYSVVQVAEILGISSDRLRTYDEQNLVCPYRNEKDRKRLYSELDIEWLKDLRLVISKNRMNIYSFKVLLKFMNAISKDDLSKLAKSEKKDELWQILLKMRENPNFTRLT